MARRLVIVDRETPMLLPCSIQDWVPEDDMARFILEAVEAIEESHCHYNWRGTGSAQYPPRMMLALLIYSYAHGTFSSRAIERATHRDIAVRFITANHHPDHDTIASFRSQNRELFKACFVQVLELARAMKLKRLGEVALDGSKIAANASLRRVVKYEELQQRSLHLQGEVDRLMEQARRADEADNAGADGTRLPTALTDAIARRDEMRRAMQTLEQRTRQAAVQRDKDRDDFDPGGPGVAPRPLEATPAPTATLNLTDPDARLLPCKSSGGYEPSYNVQLAVQADPAVPLILACGVCDEPHDRRQLAPMGSELLGLHSDTTRLVVDRGYDNSAQIHQLESRHGVIVYCPPEESPRHRSPTTRTSAARQRTQDYRQGMRACLQSDYGRRSQRLRATTVEPVFGWIKRTLGFTRFQLRGLSKVMLEWDLVCTAFNLQLLHRHAARAATA